MYVHPGVDDGECRWLVMAAAAASDNCMRSAGSTARQSNAAIHRCVAAALRTYRTDHPRIRAVTHELHSVTPRRRVRVDNAACIAMQPPPTSGAFCSPTDAEKSNYLQDYCSQDRNCSDAVCTQYSHRGSLPGAGGATTQHAAYLSRGA